MFKPFFSLYRPTAHKLFFFFGILILLGVLMSGYLGGYFVFSLSAFLLFWVPFALCLIGTFQMATMNAPYVLNIQHPEKTRRGAVNGGALFILPFALLTSIIALPLTRTSPPEIPLLQTTYSISYSYCSSPDFASGLLVFPAGHYVNNGCIGINPYLWAFMIILLEIICIFVNIKNEPRLGNMDLAIQMSEASQFSISRKQLWNVLILIAVGVVSIIVLVYALNAVT